MLNYSYYYALQNLKYILLITLNFAVYMGNIFLCEAVEITDRKTWNRWGIL